MRREDLILECALEVGFDVAGIAPCREPLAAARFQTWLEAGHHAGLEYLERHRERIVDPRKILPGAASILVVGLGHSRAPIEWKGGGRVARYALGRDYHNVVGKLLRKLVKRIDGLGAPGRTRCIVDAGPLLERSHAAEAGLGFESKAANLLHDRFGPWFFLGEVLIAEELEPTPTPAPGSCGTCTACLDACPTQAILSPGVVDAGRCISYHTIENREEVPVELRPSFGDWVFGCDVCSEVCPWGHRAPDVGNRFGVHAAIEGGSLVGMLQRREADFSEELRGSPLQRPRRTGLARNAAIALGNRPSEEGLAALRLALEEDASPVVREAAAWAIATGHGDDRGTRELVERAARRAPTERERDRVLRALDDAPERVDSSEHD